jgi:hypothetical protein
MQSKCDSFIGCLLNKSITIIEYYVNIRKKEYDL